MASQHAALLIGLDRNRPKTLRSQIDKQLRDAIRCGALKAGRLADSPIASTSLRLTYLMQNFFGSAASIRDHGIIYGAFGHGRVAFIDCEDIACCAVALLAVENPREGAYRWLAGRAIRYALSLWR